MSRHRVRSLFLLALLLPACGQKGLQEALPTNRQVNVIVVSFDALRADMLGAYGNPLGLTPNMDRFANRALLFECAYSPAPATPTAFAAAFTGLLPHLSFQRWKLTPNRTLAGLFQSAGFRTAGFFNNSQLTPKRGFGKGFDSYDLDVVVDPVLMNRALDWLSEHRDDRFFAWLHLVSPHSPYQLREVSKHLYDPDYAGPFKESSGMQFNPEDPGDLERVLSLYRGEVFYSDHLFGEFVERLGDLRLMENSIIVLTADHGEAFNERGVFRHLYLFDETTRIPLMIYHPSVARPSRATGCVSLVDLLPTLASMTGIENNLSTHGWNLQDTVAAERPVVSIAMTSSDYQAVALRRGPLKLITTCRPELSHALFDLVQDPNEKVDLSHVRSEETLALRQLLERLLCGAPCETIAAAIRGASPTRGLDRDTIERLRGLGYIK